MQPIEHTRVLLVEDHRDLAETIVDFLETMGCIVDYAADGLSGLHLARTQKFDVISVSYTHLTLPTIYSV